MSADDVIPTTPEMEIGKAIYDKALAPRRGFRDDQLGIDDPITWAIIFQALGTIAAEEVTTAVRLGKL